MTAEQPLCIAFIWHMHQPHYREPLGDRYAMPWVRFHAVKDYLDMVLLLERFPSLHQTFNLTPILVDQLRDYGAERTEDHIMALARRSVADLSGGERADILNQCFELHWDCLVRPHPRYRELLDQWQELHQAGKSAEQIVAAFSDQDFEDLLMWYNLAWVDPLFLEGDRELQRWVARGQGFTRADRVHLLSKHLEIIRQIVPTYRRLQELGQIEVTTTPYAHPILPLLLDSDSARRARPHLTYPRTRLKWPEDAEEHLVLALEAYADTFGVPTTGLWPGEQAVSPEMLPLLQQHRIGWIVSDEGVLARSQGHPLPRDGQGVPLDPERLYQPYRLPAPAGETAIVFRDIVLSDLIGFSYGPDGQAEAAQDLYHRLLNIHRRFPTLADGRPPLVTIALDGENCWEHFRNDGHEFLRSFYGLVAEDPGLQMVTVREYLQQHPARASLDYLHSGSWIYADYSTWIGEPSKNQAWELLAAARHAYALAAESLPPAARRRAREHLLIAEGSDWFWWFGEGHASASKHVFDRLFRHRLQAMYAALELPVPGNTGVPVRPKAGTGPLRWHRLQTLELAGAAGAMHAGNRALERLQAGYGPDGELHLLVTFTPDTHPDSSQHLAIGFFFPEQARVNSRLRLPESGVRPHILEYLFSHTVKVVADGEHLQAWLEEAEPGHGWRQKGLVDAAVSDREGREWDIVLPLERLDAPRPALLAAVAFLVDHTAVSDYTPQPLLIPT